MLTSSEIILKYPELFGEPPFDPTETLIAFGFEVSKHWLPIIDKYLPKISKEVKDKDLNDFRVVQVKEKFGTLRFYTRNSTKTIQNIINEMEAECGHTCGRCGSPDGIYRESMWFRVTCDECEEKYYGNKDK